MIFFEDINCGVVEFIAIDKTFQSSGIGSQLYSHAIDLMKEDALSSCNGNNKNVYLFCEIEKMRDNTKNDNKYLYFWNKMGFRKLDFKYIQPALECGKDDVISLDLILSPLFYDFVKENIQIRSKIVEDFLYYYIKFSMRIEDPEKHKKIKNMFNEVKSKMFINCLPIL